MAAPITRSLPARRVGLTEALILLLILAVGLSSYWVLWMVAGIAAGYALSGSS